MNTRTIVLILALFSLISTVTGGYFYYHSIQKTTVKEIDSNLAQATEDLKENIVGLIAVSQNQVRAMSLIARIQKALLNQDQSTLSEANRALDQFAEGFAHDVCYLMDSSGNTIASSNRNSQDSFFGHNYSFRPYFADAIKGKLGIYWAVGVTSGSRGIYFSHPVYSTGGGQPIGVVVIKSSPRELDKALSRNKMGISLLVHSSGIIFSSNQENLVLKLFSKPSPEELLNISKTQQFGKGPWDWSGFEEKPDNRVLDSSGEVYVIKEIGLAGCPGWKIVSLYSVRAVYGKIDLLMRKTGYVVLFLCLLFVGAVIVLFVMAQRDNKQRKRAEDALRDSEEQFRILFATAADGILILDAEEENRGKIVSANPAAIASSGYTADELLTLKISDLDTPESAEQFPRRFEQLLRGEVLRDEVTHQRKDGSVYSLAICDSLFVQAGHKYIVAMHRDITESKRLEQEKQKLIIDLQKALSEVKKLSGFLPICASCKKIRDDKGYWNEIERYVGEHSEAQFSHSVCPDCMRKLYPEYADEVLGRLGKDEKK